MVEAGAVLVIENGEVCAVFDERIDDIGIDCAVQRGISMGILLVDVRAGFEEFRDEVCIGIVDGGFPRAVADRGICAGLE